LVLYTKWIQLAGTGAFVKDDFTKRTIDRLAKRAGYLCSNPECRIRTVGAKHGDDGFAIVGEACHITAASPNGPRYDYTLTRDQRRHQSNGIWLCGIHGKQVDSDDQHFTVEMLQDWKRAAEDESFRAIVAPASVRIQRIRAVAPESAEGHQIEALGLSAQDDVETISSRLNLAARADLNAFKGSAAWPRNAITLNLRMTNGDIVRAFHASGLAEAIQTFNQIIVIAPPGTGKTTTLIQVVEAVLSQGTMVAAFVPLGEWSSRRIHSYNPLCAVKRLPENVRSILNLSRNLVGWPLFWTVGTSLTRYQENVPRAKSNRYNESFRNSELLSAHVVRSWMCRFPGRLLKSTDSLKASSWRSHMHCAARKAYRFSNTRGEHLAFVNL
jgi:hypothetical protein